MTEKGGKERACEESVRPVLDDKELEDFVEMQKKHQHKTEDGIRLENMV